MALTKVTSDGITDGTIIGADLATNVDLVDNQKIRFGTGNDLEIFHGGSNSYIDNNTGDFFIRNNSNAIKIRPKNDEESIVAHENGAVELHYDGSKKLETTSDGVKITAAEGGEAILSIHADEGDDNGDQYRIRVPNNDGFRIETGSSHETALKLDVNAGVELYYDNVKKLETSSTGGIFRGTTWTAVDNCKIALGTGDDLQIYHDGTNNIINDANSAKIKIQRGGSDVWELKSTGLQGIDNQKLMLGTSDDLQIYHDGSNSYILNAVGSGQLTISSDNALNLASRTGTEYFFRAYTNGGAELYYDNSKKFETTNTGGHFTGKFTFNDGNTNQIAFGNGEDLKFWHDGTDSFIQNVTGVLKVLNHVFEVKNDAATETILRGSANAAVELYYNNTLRFYTNSDAVTMRGGGDHRCEGNFRPWQDNVSDLGTSSDRWDDIYATNDTIQTSDRNEKNTIVDTDLGLTFVNKLKPVSYKFNNKTRTHYGLIAQDVETTLSDISKPTSGFAGFIKEDIPDKLYVEDDDIPEGKKVGDVKTAAFTTYGLRYNEFIAPLIKAVQELSAEVETLKTEVAALKAS
jgi:hypothetical protein